MQSSNVRDDVEALLQRLAHELPVGAARLRIFEHGVELTPANSAAAKFSVIADESAVYTFSFGSRSYWEFPYERRYRYDEKSVSTEIEEMSKAVIAGHCEEGRGLLSVSGRIYVGDYTYRTTTIPVLSLPRFGTRRYVPYSPINSNC